MQLVWALFGVALAISISTPFVNQYLQEAIGLNLGFVYILSSLLAIFIFALQCRRPINLKYFILLCLLIITFVININSDLTNGFISVLIGFTLCLPFLQNHLPAIFSKSLVITLFLFACFFFSLITTDSRLLELIYLNTRMAMGNSPISIAIIAAISVLICTYHFSSVNNFKKILLVFFIMFFIAAILYSGSRGPLLALFAILSLQLARSGKVIMLSITSVLGSLSALFILSIRENHNDSSSSRINLYQEAFKIVSESPLGGFHIGKYTYLTGKPFPHNFFLEIWVDFNVFFLFIILSLTLYVIYQRYTTLHKKVNIRSKLMIDIYILIFICCQMSLPSTEMLRVLLPLLFISMCCISNEKLNVKGLK
ncbi:O-antigen ligase [Pseudoalteromonas sp.]|uniref:O-antigen ligase family protein n=1 Tax=Pseudoalteromonas sp. TaxID=53249 RepID=UPI002615CAEE|nr:O-antigen ligase family protein [Pseudoalteromonas sp.]MCP4588118.1 O-antigen ligase family protein [Pseudoalteromonas sp.]